MQCIHRPVRAFAAAVLALGAGASLAQTCAPFNDVAANNPFCASIQWMHNRAITLGCETNAYCPDEYVRRDQMAAFMYRLGFQNAFLNGGNAFGAPARIGTTDEHAVEIAVNGLRTIRLEPAVSPNVIVGHRDNEVDPGVRGATIGGGGITGSGDPDFSDAGPNRIFDAYGTVAGGMTNMAGLNDGNRIDQAFATVGGGVANAASGLVSTVGGGTSNVAQGQGSTIGGGSSNFANAYATVPGGASNRAIGNFSFAAGFRAKASTTGSFIWADSSNFDFEPSVDNFFGARATGGVGFTVAINPSTGAVTQFCNFLPGSSGWACTSDRDAKENFASPSGEAILDRLVAMPLYVYNFKGADPAIRNLGPTAQDFRSAFDLGNDDKSIAQGNLHGVALAAIQGLNARLESRIGEQAREIALQRAKIDRLSRAVEALASQHRQGASR